MPDLRIAIVGLSVEALVGSPLTTGPADMQIYRGEELPKSNLWLVRGVLKRLAEERDVEACPLIWATALPGGALTEENYRAILDETLALLDRNGPFDGVVICNHGALEVAGFDVDADTDFITAIRKAIGPTVPIGLALDLHGDMTPAMLEAVTVISALRTAPHRDDPQTGYRTADQLLRVIREGLSPKTAAVRIPILTSGEGAVTTQEPGRSLYASLSDIDVQPGVMEANILVGFAFNDRPWTGMTAFVTCEESAADAARHAKALAAEIWRRRAEFELRMETASLQEGLDRALASAARPVYVSDSGDNTTAGAPGDHTTVLQALLARNDAPDAVVPGILAPALVKRAIAAGPGAEIEVELGAEHISAPDSRMTVTGRIEACGPELVLGGFQPYRSAEGGWAKIRFGSVIATFHDLPIGITTPAHFGAMGIDPTGHSLYVVKLGYLHPQLEDIAVRHILLLTDGTVSLDLLGRNWKYLSRPIYPLEDDAGWTPDRGLYLSAPATPITA